MNIPVAGACILQSIITVLLFTAGFNSGVMGAMILLGNVAGAAAGLTFTVSCLGHCHCCSLTKTRTQ